MDHLEMRIQVQVNRLQRLLPPVTYSRCQQAAWMIQRRLPALLAVPDWEANLLREIRRELSPQAPQRLMITAITPVIAAVIILINNIKAKSNEHNAAARKEKLNTLVSKIIVKLERQQDEAMRGGLHL